MATTKGNDNSTTKANKTDSKNTGHFVFFLGDSALSKASNNLTDSKRLDNARDQCNSI